MIFHNGSTSQFVTFAHNTATIIINNSGTAGDSDHSNALSARIRMPADLVYIKQLNEIWITQYFTYSPLSRNRIRAYNTITGAVSTRDVFSMGQYKEGFSLAYAENAGTVYITLGAAIYGVNIGSDGSVGSASQWCGRQTDTSASNTNCNQASFGGEFLGVEVSRNEQYVLVADYSNERVVIIRRQNRLWTQTISFTDNVLGICLDSKRDDVVYVTTRFTVERVVIPLLIGDTTTPTSKTRYAGSGTSGNTDGDRLNARFNGPKSCISKGDYLFVSDLYNSRLRIIGDDATGGVKTYAYSTSGSANGDLLTAARMTAPAGMVEVDGILYVSDLLSNKVARIEDNCWFGEGNQVFDTCNDRTCRDITVVEMCPGVGYCASVNNTSQCVSQCSGVWSYNSTVCSGHGECVAGSCNCTASFNGTNCEIDISVDDVIPACFGINANETQVCSSHGNCTSMDYCACNSGWVGMDCSVTQCFGIMSNLTEVCSGNGHCVALDSCTCDEAYKGANCSLPTVYSCFSVLSNDSNVCSGRGNCTDTDFCVCGSGYSGPKCEHTQCFGAWSHQSGVCSGHGQCTEVDNCDCGSSGYLGAQCDEFKCFGVNSLDTQVCTNGNGVCVSPDTCSCFPNYSGEKCEEWNGECPEGFYGPSCSEYSCNGIDSQDPSVCNGRGTCQSSSRTCNCTAGYSGAYCGDILCYGKPSRDPSVCSSKGSCTGVNQCDCHPQYSGEQCEQHSCYSKSNTDPTVCSSHGSCTAADTCQCADGYTGMDCSLTQCFGISEIDSRVCSSRGACTGPNSCSCMSGFFGSQCEAYLCYGQMHNHTDTCSQHGVCSAPDSCICVNIDFFGDQCDSYACFHKASTDPSTCSGNGDCIALNQCNCTQGWSGNDCSTKMCFGLEVGGCLNGGECLGGDVCACASGYTGTRCEQAICFGFAANDPAVCNARGTCDSPNHCSCNGGTFFDDACAMPMCFGKRGAEACNYPHGRCAAPDSCICDSLTKGEQCFEYSDFLIPINEETHSQLPPADDYTTGALPLKSGVFKIYNTTLESVYITADGLISLNEHRPPSHTDFDFSNAYDVSMLLFGFADMDLRSAPASSGVWWRQSAESPTTEDIINLANLTKTVRNNYASSGNFSTFSATWYLVVTANEVGYYSQKRDRLNNVQVVLFSDELQDNSFLLFNFKERGLEHPISEPKIGLYDASGGDHLDLLSHSTSRLSMDLHKHTNSISKGYYLYPMHLGSPRPGLFSCGGRLSTDIEVCEGHGRCVQNEECICDNYYGGVNCERDCRSIGNSTWTGISCATPLCFGIPAYSADVCQGHGTCVAPDTCNCLATFSGADCAAFSCFNISMNSPSVCSSHGACVRPDVCVCTDGYSHNSSAPQKDCHHITCDGMLAGSAGECNGRGVCIGPNQCVDCVPPFFGRDCDEAKRFVSPMGSDSSNNCLDRASPCKTLQHALAQASNRNDIILLNGTHTIPTTLQVEKSVTISGEDEVFIHFDTVTALLGSIFQVQYRSNVVLLHVRNLNLIGINRPLVRIVHSPAASLVLDGNNIVGTDKRLVEVYGYCNVGLVNNTIQGFSAGLVWTSNTERQIGSRVSVEENRVSATRIAVDSLFHCEYVETIQTDRNQFAQIEGQLAFITNAKQVSLSGDVLQNCTFGSRGALELKKSNTTVRGMQLHNLVGMGEGGVFIVEECAIEIFGIVANTVHGRKGIVLSGANALLSLQNSTLTHVHALSSVKVSEFLAGNAAAIHATGSGSVVIGDANFTSSDTIIFVTGSTPLTIMDSHFTNISHGAVQIVNNVHASVLVEGCVFDNVRNINGFGSGLSNFWSRDRMIVRGCTFTHTTALSGGALAADGLDTIIMQRNTFEACSAVDMGGALYLNDVNATLVEESTFSRGVARLGGSIYLTRLVEKYFSVRSGGLTVRNSAFVRNHATESAGCIYASVENVCKVYGTVFEHNYATQSGGVFFMEGAMLETYLNGSSIMDILSQSGVSFGSLLLSDQLPGFVISHCALRNNSAFVGGSISLFSSNIEALVQHTNISMSQAATSGGFMYALAKSVELDYVQISDTKAERGSCLYVLMSIDGVSLQRSQFSRCTATKGSCVEVHSSSRPVTLVSSRFESCTSESSSAGVFVSGIALEVSQSHFSNNRAINGSAILALEAPQLIIGDSTFINNTAVNFGGAVYVSNRRETGGSVTPDIKVANNTFAQNSASFGASVHIDLGDISNMISAQNTFDSGEASVAGGDFFFERVVPLWAVENPPGLDVSSTALSYGDSRATQPKSIRIKRALLSGTTAPVQSSLPIFSGQAVTLVAEVLDALGQVVQFYPGITFEVKTTAVRILQSKTEEMIQRGELVFDFSLFSLSGSQETITIKSTSADFIQPVSINATIQPCALGYRLATHDDGRTMYHECQRCPKSSYSIKFNAETCNFDCDTFTCEGGTSVSWGLGYWYWVDTEQGHIKSFPCVNGYCSGGRLNMDFMSQLQHQGNGTAQMLQQRSTSLATRSHVPEYPYEGANCGNFHTGILCGDCLPGYAEWKGVCVKCEKGYNLGMLALYLLYFVLLCTYAYISSQKNFSDTEFRIFIGFVQNLVQTVEFGRWASVNPDSKWSPFISYYSILLTSLADLQPPMSAFSFSNTEVDMCPFTLPGYSFFHLQLAENLGMFVVFSIPLFISLGVFVTFRVVKWVRARWLGKNQNVTQEVGQVVRQEESRNRYRVDDLSMVELSTVPPIETTIEDGSDEGIEQPTKTETKYDIFQQFTAEETTEEEKERERKKNLRLAFKRRLQNFAWRMLSPASFVRTIASLIIAVHQPLTKTVLSYLMGCFKFKDDYRIMTKTNLLCWNSPEYWLWAVLLYIPTLICLVAVPVGVALFLRANRSKMEPPSLLDDCMQTFYDIYKLDTFWWEIVNFARKILLTLSWNLSLILLLSYNVNGIHFVFFAILYSLNFLLVMHYRPYKRKIENQYELFCFFVLIVICAFQDGYGSSSEDMGVILSFTLSVVVVLILIAFVLKETWLYRKTMGRVLKFVVHFMIGVWKSFHTKSTRMRLKRLKLRLRKVKRIEPRTLDMELVFGDIGAGPDEDNDDKGSDSTHHTKDAWTADPAKHLRADAYALKKQTSNKSFYSALEEEEVDDDMDVAREMRHRRHTSSFTSLKHMMQGVVAHPFGARSASNMSLDALPDRVIPKRLSSQRFSSLSSFDALQRAANRLTDEVADKVVMRSQSMHNVEDLMSDELSEGSATHSQTEDDESSHTATYSYSSQSASRSSVTGTAMSEEWESESSESSLSYEYTYGEVSDEETTEERNQSPVAPDHAPKAPE